MPGNGGKVGEVCHVCSCPEPLSGGTVSCTESSMHACMLTGAPCWQERMIVEYDNARVLITDQKLETIKEVLPLLEQLTRINAPLLIIAEDVTGAAARLLGRSHARSYAASRWSCLGVAWDGPTIVHYPVTGVSCYKVYGARLFQNHATS